MTGPMLAASRAGVMADRLHLIGIGSKYMRSIGHASVALAQTPPSEQLSMQDEDMTAATDVGSKLVAAEIELDMSAIDDELVPA